MPDITMCKDRKCTFHKFCYRYRAIPSGEYQSYFSYSPYDEKLDKCDYFWKITKEKLRK